MTWSRHPSRRSVRAELLAKSALCGILAGMLAVRQANALPSPTNPTTQVSSGGSAPIISTSPSGFPTTMIVATDASRTVINWNSYVINSGETVDYTFNNRSDIALNVLPASQQVQINGNLNAYIGSTSGPYGGNVWFSAPGGVIFGSTAKVEVGGLLATTGVINSTSFVNATTSFPFTAYTGSTSGYPGLATSNTSGGAGITVAGLSGTSFPQLTARGGLIALIAPFINVGSGAQIQSKDDTATGGYGGAGSVLYGAAQGFTLTLTQESSGDLDMLQFIINDPSQVTDYPVLLQGQTQGTNVYVASLSAAGIANAVVKVTGLVTATEASTGPGGEIILSSGSDTINAPTYAPGASGFPGTYTPGSATTLPGSSYPAVQIDLAGADASGGRDVQIIGGGEILSSGAIQAGTDVTLTAGDTVYLTSITAGGGVDVTTAGATRVSSTLQANGGNATLVAGGGISLLGSASASGDFTVNSTTTSGPTTYGAGTVNTSDVSAGGDIEVEGTSVYAASLTAGNTVNVASYYSGAGSRGLANADVGAVTAGGDITLTANDGYASLTSVTFTGAGQTLQVSAFDPADVNPIDGTAGNVYLGYARNTGSGPGTAGGSGGVTNAGTVDLNADDDILVDVSGDAALGEVTAGGAVNITAAGAISVSSTLQANGGSATLTAGTGITLQGSASASGDFTATSTNTSVSPTLGTGPIRTLDVTSTSGSIDLEGSSVYATSLTAQDNVTATAYYAGASHGLADVDVGSATAADAITLTANDGYASLTSVTFTSGSRALQITAHDPAGVGPTDGTTGNVYLGYAQNTGSGPGQSGGSGGVNGFGTVNLSADDNVLIDVSGDLAPSGSIGAGGGLTAKATGDLNLTSMTLSLSGGVSLTGATVELGSAPTSSGYPAALTIDVTGGSFSDSSALQAVGDIEITASSKITLGDVTSSGGSVILDGGAKVTFGNGQADTDFIATSITGAPGAGTASSPDVGVGAIDGGDVTATNGYIDLEGSNVTASTLTAGGSNPSNGYSIYAAAWGTSAGHPGALSLVSPDPSGPYSTTADFLYPTPSPTPTPTPTPAPTPTPTPAPTPTPTPTVALPLEDASFTPEFDASGAAPVITPPTGGGTTDTVELYARRTVIDWTSFQIGAGGEVEFVFNPASGQSAANARGDIVLNQITGGGSVDIEGALASTVSGDSHPYGGNVWFSAPGGVIFGSGAVVNVGGLLATTAAISPANLTSQFLDASNFTFQFAGGTAGVDVAGGAQIDANGSLVVLAGSSVEVQPGASVANADVNGAGTASILYAAAPSFSLEGSQPDLGGGAGDIGFASFVFGQGGIGSPETSDLSASTTPLDLEGTTSASNVYVAALSPTSISGAQAKLTGSITASSASGGAGGEIILSTGADTITAGAAPTPTTGAVSPLGVSLGDVQAGGSLELLASGSVSAPSLSAGGGLLVSSGGSASLGTATAGSSARIVAASLDLTTGLTAPTVSIESLDGPLALGGASAPSGGGLWLSDAEFGLIRASGALSLYAGSTTGTARGDLTVADLTIDPAKTPVVELYAAPTQTVSVTGTVAPVASGGQLDIGGASSPDWTPGQILVSGALGLSTRVSDTDFTNVSGFDQINLDAGDILIGSSRFIALVQAASADSIDIADNQPAGVAATGSEIGKVFITAGQLNIIATGKVVQQNTSGSTTSFSGLYLTNNPGSPGPVLTIDPPTVAALFGTFVSPSGALISGQQASLSSVISILGLGGNSSLLSRYQFNGCLVGAAASCGSTTGSTQGVQPGQQFQSSFLAQAGDQSDSDSSGASGDSSQSDTQGATAAGAASQSGSSSQPNQVVNSELLPIAPPPEFDEQTDPVVTGTGNEEIWRKRPGGSQ
jgi:filamentous hemagglutinin family protein